MDPLPSSLVSTESIFLTMCAFLFPKSISSACGGNKFVYRGVSEDQKRIMVTMHNEMRSKVATGKESRAR